jgi:hypothetical protein
MMIVARQTLLGLLMPLGCMLFLQWHQLETMFISAKTYYKEKLLPFLA